MSWFNEQFHFIEFTTKGKAFTRNMLYDNKKERHRVPKRTGREGAGEMAEDKIICKCNNTGKKEIKKAVKSGASSVKEVRQSLNMKKGCGGCDKKIKKIIKKVQEKEEKKAEKKEKKK